MCRCSERRLAVALPATVERLAQSVRGSDALTPRLSSWSAVSDLSDWESRRAGARRWSYPTSSYDAAFPDGGSLASLRAATVSW